MIREKRTSPDAPAVALGTLSIASIVASHNILKKRNVALAAAYATVDKTFKEYRKYIEKDSALERRFQPVTVSEPTVEDTITVLKGIKQYYENFHRVKISDDMAKRVLASFKQALRDLGAM